jgi:RNA polymerase sigma factor (sigma-70 family)
LGGNSPYMREPLGDPGEPRLPQTVSAESSAEQRDQLKRALETDYDGLVQRLAMALRSQDRAADALHDTYLRLSGSPAVGQVRNPLAYLYRMAINLAHNVRQRELRSVALPPSFIDGWQDLDPGPERTAIALVDHEKLLTELGSLPDQRRNIFLARWRDGLSHADIASRFGLHKRTVQKELARAERHLHAWRRSAD